MSTNATDARDEEIKMLARDHAELAIETLADVMRDSEAKHNAKVQAADIMLKRGFGAPERRTTSEVNVNVYDQRKAHFDALQSLARSRRPLLIEDASFTTSDPEAESDTDDDRD